MADDATNRTVQILKLLGDATRLRIVRFLATGPCAVHTLCAALKLPQPTISHHLGILRHQGVLIAERCGKSVFYKFAAGTKFTKTQFILPGVSIDR